MIERTKYQLFVEGHQTLSPVDEKGILKTIKGNTVSTWKQISSNKFQRISSEKASVQIEA